MDTKKVDLGTRRPGGVDLYIIKINNTVHPSDPTTTLETRNDFKVQRRSTSPAETQGVVPSRFPVSGVVTGHFIGDLTVRSLMYSQICEDCY